jgi:general L-amino acid transport system substrate-binding protein
MPLKKILFRQALTKSFGKHCNLLTFLISLLSLNLLDLPLAKALDSTLEQVRKRGFLKCGVSTGVIGFSSVDSKGLFGGIDVDLCRAIGASVFGRNAQNLALSEKELLNKVKYVPLSAQQRFTALQSGEVDVLTRNTTLTLSRDTSLNFNFGPVNFYDGQGFIVRAKDKITSVNQLDGATVCIQPGTTSELNVADFFRSKKMKFKPLVIENNEEVFKAFISGRCDTFSSDRSQLAADRSKVPNPNDYAILPEVISKEPFAPVVRQGDDQWLSIVSWSFYALVEAEELGITEQNVELKQKETDPRVGRLLGVIAGNGKSLGLHEKWAYDIIKLLGNYEEVFNRNLGAKTPLKMMRGLNRLWNKGGLMYAPPLR